MKQKLNCKQVTRHMKAIRSQKTDFEKELIQNNLEACEQMVQDISSKIEALELAFWPFEIFTEKSFEKQHLQWQDMYESFDSEYKIPTKERIWDFIRKDPSFIKLMEEKEQYGFTKLIIAPAPGFYSFKKLVDKTGEMIKRNGGKGVYITSSWSDTFNNEETIKYFRQVEHSRKGTSVKDGVTNNDILKDPDKYSICDGWIISLTTNKYSVAWIDPKTEAETAAGRKPMKTGLSAIGYEKEYFSDLNDDHKSERSIIPQEHFAMFARDYFERYVKHEEGLEYMDFYHIIEYSSVRFQKHTSDKRVPTGRWSPVNQQFSLDIADEQNQNDLLGVQSVIRRNLSPKTTSNKSFIHKILNK